MAKYIDISDWINNEWSSPSKGSRPQKILSDPESDDEYFFKQSSAKYPAEFWSEIIASEIGQLADINILTYHVASYNGILGCLSKSMTPNPLSQLYHGVDVLRDYLPGFEISNKPIHSFQQLMILCEETEEFIEFKDDFIQMILFDALIGNTDRHTENWAFLVALYLEPQSVSNVNLKPRKNWQYFLPSFMRKAITYDMDAKLEMKFIRKVQFSPVYDSGSCLGRELSDDRIGQLLSEKNQISTYLDRSKHEIRWNDLKINSFELVRNISEAEPVITKVVLESFFDKLTPARITEVVDNVDKEIVGKVEETYLSLQRKALVKTLLLARLERLKKYLSVS